MRFVQIPKIDSAWDNVSIKTLSPSTFAWVNRGCGYQVLLQNALQTFNNRALSLPSNPNAILGTIIHKLYELSIKGEVSGISDMKSMWDKMVAEEEDKIIEVYPTLRNASINDYVKRNKAIRYAMGMTRGTSNSQSERSTKVVLSEKWLDCSDIGLKGIADKLVINDDCVDIIDFKSGYVNDDNGCIKEEYVIQLHLYAAMCLHLSMGKPRNLTLIDIEGINHDVPYRPEYSKQLLSSVNDSLSTLNNAVSRKDFSSLAKPNLDMCKYCSCRHICQYRNIPAESIYKTITGKVKEIPSSNMYVIETGANLIYISGMEVYNVEESDEYKGKTLTFVNIIRASQVADEYTYKVTEKSLIYEQL